MRRRRSLLSTRDRLSLLTWMLVAILALATFVPSIIPDASAQGARNLTVLVGGGQDTVQALAFFPQNVRIRQGDTITWKDVVDEPHTTTFTKGFDPGPASVGSPLEVPGTMIPGAIIPIPGAGPDGLQFNPQMAWPTRAPGAPVE